MTATREQWLAEMSESLGVDPDDVLEVAAMFFKAIDGRLSGIENAYQAGDMNELRRLAHGLKGDAANMRFRKSSQLARTLEMQSKDGNVTNFEAQFKALCDAVQEQKRSLGLDFEAIPAP